MERDGEWAISAIVLWEIAKLRHRGLIKLDLDTSDAGSLIAGLRVLPITVEIARASQRLDFEADPADELIAATSIVHRAPLLTRDSAMLASRVVPLAVR